MRVSPRFATATAAACGLVLLAAPLSWPASGTGPEPSIAPSGGVFAFEGHGYGHGRGMSQWGARGAARLGVPYEQILLTYYPGTDAASTSDQARIHVHVTADNDNDVRVSAQPGLTVSTGGLSLRLPEVLSGSSVRTWRVRLQDGKPHLEGLAGNSGWLALPLALPLAGAAGPMAFGGAADFARLVLPSGRQRDYRGKIVAVADGTGRLRTVNDVSMEDYLRAVVPAESPGHWEQGALRAQAVAARTYALWRTANRPLGFADICDTTACQVYPGVRAVTIAGRISRTYEAASTTDAVRATAGRYLRYRGSPSFTEFSSSNGGYSTPGDFPYLPARPDPWDGIVPSSVHSWTTMVPASRISARWPSVGEVVSLQVRSRDGRGEWNGRVTSLQINGTLGSKTVSGATFANGANVRHRWFHPQNGK